MKEAAKAKPDSCVHFPDWSRHLDASGLPEAERLGYRATLGWYLAFCRRGGRGASFASAREFIEVASARQRASQEQVEQWREALRWFFRQARAGSRPPVAPKTEGDWEGAVRRMLRLRHYSYRTEQSYLDWVRRLVRFHRGRSPEEMDERCLKQFLDDLAVRRRVSASTQKQALNALVFLLREVLGRELGDFSDYERASRRARLPVVLSRQEVAALFDRLEGTSRLMARLLYGSGLRLMELIRLRVHPVR